MKKEQYINTIENLTDREILFHLYITQFILILFSMGLGFFLFDHWSSFIALFQWNDPQILSVGILAGGGVVFLDVFLMKILPPSFYDDGGLNNRIFKNRNIWQIFCIAATVAICEEILFRGVLQTHFGLILSSTIFALIHIRYLFNPFLFLNIVLLSFFVGYVYLITGNLVVTIMMHFLIDFLLGLLLRFNSDKNSPVAGGE